ncbi:hypothetical protein AK812_SmicGene10710 [Symbiodinium microadriaticum]|uniref:SAM domain-containing protein n=1 Tax=Symbiodinium microadriaticum TaxID=2951 RepID=A0A1Q9EF96_SYMMI|nr:hypothetical protein AK812_SmicGene10710 [Symbiodinium microadriaticum]
MESQPAMPWIHQWLASIDAVLVTYASKFEDLGYDSRNILSQMTTEELKSDLEGMSVKHAHGRMILKHHAKLQEATTSDAETASPVQAQASSSGAVEGIAQRLPPFVADAIDFQPKVFIPVLCLRWAQGKIHGQMVFTSGAFKDRSMFELFIDLATGRQRVEEIDPLEVVVHGSTLDVVGGSRRATVLRMLQGIWGHITIRAPCHLFHPTDPKVASRFQAKDTTTGGAGILFHGRQQEAWHMGKPLFRCAQEWCDLHDDSVRSDLEPLAHHATSGAIRPSQTPALSTINEAMAPMSTFAQHDSHGDEVHAIQRSTSHKLAARSSVTFRATGQGEASNLENEKCAQSNSHESQEVSAIAEGPRSGRHTTHGSSTNAARREESHVQPDLDTADPFVLRVGMIVLMAGPQFKFGEVIEISPESHKAAPIKVQYDAPFQKVARFAVDDLQVPDYSSLSTGMPVSVSYNERVFYCSIIQISTEASRSRAPVQVRYQGYTSEDDEWVGADRLRTKSLTYAQPKLPDSHMASQVSEEGEEACDGMPSRGTFVCCMWLEGKCHRKGQHWLAGRLYLHEDVPGMSCGFGDNCRYLHYARRASTNGDTTEGSSSIAARCEESHVGPELKTVDPCVLRVGMIVLMAGPQFKFKFGEVIEISPESHKAAPIKVQYDAPFQKVARFAVDDLQAPDYSSLSTGMPVSVSYNERVFYCSIIQISTEASRSRAPVQVRYQGYTSEDDEWVGADRLHSKSLTYAQPTLPDSHMASQVSEEGEEACDGMPSRGTFVCCMWLEGKCYWKGQHWLAGRLYLHEDVPGMHCGFGERCTYLHYQRRKAQKGDTMHGSSSVAAIRQHLRVEPDLRIADPFVLREGMIVFMDGPHFKRKSRKYGEVIEISHDSHKAAPIKVRYGEHSGHEAWFAVDDLQVPDYGSLSTGMEMCVCCNEGTFSCTVMQIEPSRPVAPVHVRYNGYASDNDEWVGADRLRTSSLKYVQPKLDSQMASQLSEEGEEPCGSSNIAARREASRVEPDLRIADPFVLREGMIVFMDGPHFKRKSRKYGEVIEISHDSHKAAPIKVRYGEHAGQEAWFAVDDLQVPDYGSLSTGMEMCVCCNEGTYSCTVMQIEPSRPVAPVHVRYNGYASDNDEWVGADRLRTSSLKYVQPKLDTQSEFSHPNCAGGHAAARSTQCPSAANQTSAKLLPSMPASHEPLPWNEAESEDDEDAATKLDSAITAVGKALQQQGTDAAWQLTLEETLRPPAASPLVASVLSHYGWMEASFSSEPELQKLHDHLVKLRSDLFEDASSCCTDSDPDSGGAVGLAEALVNDGASSCAMQAGSLDELLEAQRDTIDKLEGTLICGTFRCVAASSEGKLKHCGEVIVERGPGPMIGCRVRIPAGRSRGNAWDCDRCYVRILVAAFSGLIFPADGAARKVQQTFSANDFRRTELYGRIVHCKALGVPRQKLFVCSKSKKTNHERYVAFKAINGKLPPIQVPWPKGTTPASISDLHVVEVRSWDGDRPPRGKYVKSLKMHARNSDAAILEPVQISMNFCDWEPEQKSVLPAAGFPRPDLSSRVHFRNSSPVVGIQHKGVPTSVVVSCTPDTGLHVHVLDINAYLDSPELQHIRKLVQRRAVGVWFMDHEDMPLDANLPFFPPEMEKELTFAEGCERAAVTFTFPFTEHQVVDMHHVQISETIVRCDSLLSPADAGRLILGEADGDAIGRTLRLVARLAKKFEDAEVARESLALFEHLDISFSRKACSSARFAQLISSRTMRTLAYMVDRHVGNCLMGQSWSELLVGDAQPSSSALSVTYSHSQPDPSTWKVMERMPCSP